MEIGTDKHDAEIFLDVPGQEWQMLNQATGRQCHMLSGIATKLESNRRQTFPGLG